MRELGAEGTRVCEVENALAGLPSAQKVAVAEVVGDVPLPPSDGGGKKKSVRL
jgi:hypothetical protein